MYAEALMHAAATASNDDQSKPDTDERVRHVTRLETMTGAAEYITVLEHALSVIADMPMEVSRIP